MSRRPWWMDRVEALLVPGELAALGVGPLWHLSERLQFVRENVEPALLPVDFLAQPQARALWSEFEQREAQVLRALREETLHLTRSIRTGVLGPEAFRSAWEGLGFAPNAEGAGTPADDFLDGVFQVSRLTTGEARPTFGTLNMASRAHRIADFLAVTRPGADDVVFDLGSGAGKLALTVAASSVTQVRGVEYGGAYVAAARTSADLLGLSNVGFLHADVRDIDLSGGSIFYLYYPFHGDVARAVAEALGRLGRTRAITVYASGPSNDFGEYFLRQVENGSLLFSERRGEFGEVMMLRSARA